VAQLHQEEDVRENEEIQRKLSSSTEQSKRGPKMALKRIENKTYKITYLKIIKSSQKLDKK
jgi:hypothetical protein